MDKTFAPLSLPSLAPLQLSFLLSAYRQALENALRLGAEIGSEAPGRAGSQRRLLFFFLGIVLVVVVVEPKPRRELLGERCRRAPPVGLGGRRRGRPCARISAEICFCC